MSDIKFSYHTNMKNDDHSAYLLQHTYLNETNFQMWFAEIVDKTVVMYFICIKCLSEKVADILVTDKINCKYCSDSKMNIV